MSDAISPDPEWVDARKAAKMLGLPSVRNVRRLAERGLIKVRDRPGAGAEYVLADVERLAESERGRTPEPRVDGFFDHKPRGGEDERLISALTQYEAERRRRPADPLPLGSADPGPSFAGFEFLSYVGGLVLGQVNRALDRDPDAFLGGLLEARARGEEAGQTEGAVLRFWETLARMQAEDPLPPGIPATGG